MIQTVLVEFCNVDNIKKREVLRYCGIKEGGSLNSALEERIDELTREALKRSPFRIAVTLQTVAGCGEALQCSDSETFRKATAGCSEVILAAATLGIAFDRLLERYKKRSVSDALILQAIGTAMIEEVLDSFQERERAKLSQVGQGLRPRISAGYGDFDLSCQKAILDMLNAGPNLGIYLNESLLMVPSKSVTALWGITTVEGEICEEGEGTCSRCGKEDCAFRR